MSKLNECYLCESEIQHGEGLCESCATEANIVSGFEEAKAPEAPEELPRWIAKAELYNAGADLDNHGEAMREAEVLGLQGLLHFAQGIFDELDESLYVLPGSLAAAESKDERRLYASIQRILKVARNQFCELEADDFDSNLMYNAPKEPYAEVAKGNLNSGKYLSKSKVEGIQDALTFGSQVLDEIEEVAEFVADECLPDCQSDRESLAYAGILRIYTLAMVRLHELGITNTRKAFEKALIA